MSAQELLPCPYCECRDIRSGAGVICCNSCGAQTGTFTDWNRRAPLIAAQPVAQTGVPSDAIEAMTDSVRYLFTGMEMPGMTFRKIRAHCELSGMDTSHWPAWTRGRENEHFNKAARAALVWHIMYRAASPVPTKAGVPEAVEALENLESFVPSYISSVAANGSASGVVVHVIVERIRKIIAMLAASPAPTKAGVLDGYPKGFIWVTGTTRERKDFADALRDMAHELRQDDEPSGIRADYAQSDLAIAIADALESDTLWRQSLAAAPTPEGG